MTAPDNELLVAAWVDLQARSRLFRPPLTEDDYLALIAVLDDLTSRFDCTREPHASLFDLLAGYADRWERKHGPDLKDSPRSSGRTQESRTRNRPNVSHQVQADRETMDEVSSTYARAHLSELVRRVEAGESILITRRGRPAGILAPVKQRAEDLTEFRATHGRVQGSALQELLAMRKHSR